MDPQMQQYLNPTLITAGNNIVCQRCQAHSKRTKLQCGAPALRNKNVCRFHGGRSTGPKSAEGKARQRAAVMKEGNYSKKAMEVSSASLTLIRQLEDVMRVMGMTNADRTRGRKPLGYVPLQTVEDVVKFALDNPLHLPTAPKARQE